MEPDQRQRLGVEIAGAEGGTTATGLDKTLAMAIEHRGSAAASDRARNVPSHDLGLGVGEDARLRERLAELERDAES